MNHLARFWIFCAVCVLLAAVVSPWVYLGVQWAALTWDWQWLKYLGKHPFHRYFHRVLQAGILMGAWWLLKGSGFHSLQAFGLRTERPLGWMLAGFGLSLTVMGGYGLLMMGMGWQRWVGLADGESWFHLGRKILLTMVIVSCLEELFFRGYFYRLCLRQMSRARALAINMIFFSLVHYIKPPRVEDLPSVDWSSGFQMLGLACLRFSDPLQIVGGVIVLMVAAWFLCWTLDCASNLYLAIGLHAGWIMALQGSMELSRGATTWPAWFLGGGDLSQGILALLPLALQFWALKWWMTRGRTEKCA